MALKIILCFVVLLFTEKFLGGIHDVMIHLFESLCKCLGISIMFVVLFLNGGEWCEHGRQCDSNRDAEFEAK